MTKAADFDFDSVLEGDGEVSFMVEARDLAVFKNPLEAPPWEGVSVPLTREEVHAAIVNGNVVNDHVGPGEWLQLARGTSFDDAVRIVRARHVGRIAAFVLEMPDDPITIDVGMPSFGHDLGGGIKIEDGHHRLAAAIILDKPLLTTFSGEWEQFRSLFPDSIYSPSRLAVAPGI